MIRLNHKFTIIVIAVVAFLAMAFTGGASPNDQTASPTDATTKPVINKKVVSTSTIKAKTKKIFVKKFTPIARPTKKQIYKIIRIEGKQWNLSLAERRQLACRIKGESTFGWNKTNGKYEGLGQFASETFSRGMRSIGTRQVRDVYKIKKKTVHDEEITTYEDGTTTSKLVNPHKIKYIYIKKGMIPSNPPRTHGHAQIRIMARAIKGLGEVADSEWSVRC